MQPQPPGSFIMFGFREAEVQKVQAVFPPARDECGSHRHRYFKVVSRPTAVEVKRNVAHRFAEDALDQIILVRKRTRHTNGRSEHLWMLPYGVKRNDSTERRPPHGAVSTVIPYSQQPTGFWHNLLRKRARVCLVAGFGVVTHTIVRVNPNDYKVFYRAHSP